MILVVSYPGEEHTDIVCGHLAHYGEEVLRLDLSEFPATRLLALSWGDGVPLLEVSDGDRWAELSRSRVAWWRRVRSFVVDPAIGRDDMRIFAESETNQAVNGLLDSLSCRWVNPRGPDEAAHRKPYQWTVAQHLGLTLPRTLVTTDPQAARRFILDAGSNRVIFKPFLASSTQSWRETRVIEPEDLDRLDLVRLAPVIFQHYVDGVDLRVTIIGNKVFAAEIDARSTSYPFDMRMVIEEAGVRSTTLPTAVENRLVALMRALQLEYGAIDLRRTDDGVYMFFEVNPAGQWLFVEERTELEISRALADHLVALSRFDPCPKPYTAN